ncbi:MAG: Ppx/GppA phosphatase family protein [Candidatus Bathyarchaeia archaeon]|jgi:exopolyphosphatase/guanosine-5'-triphosphate,3'-diphosphate pyrophosphatase
MPKLAAIDVGSNAIRLAIASVDNKGKLDLIHTAREPVRLGADVFANREISNNLLVEAMDAFLKFRKLINAEKAKLVRAVGTSALREASNREYVINQIAKASEITIEPISGDEEARLVHLAVTSNIKLKRKLALIVDIGGGSVEISLVNQREILVTESFTTGTVRLLQMLEQKKRGDKVFRQLVHAYLNVADTRLKKELAAHRIGFCIATGGNVEALGELGVQLCRRKNSTSLTTQDLDSILARLESQSYEDRMKKFKLRPDRADVIIPAAIVLQNIAQHARINRILVPGVGVRDGLLIDMASKLRKVEEPFYHLQVISSAKLFGRKFDYDAQHSLNVARIALNLFDSTRRLHNLGPKERTLLEVAGLLHDIGYYIGMTDHHKHSYYLIKASPIIGLSDTQREIVAIMVRYHSRALPKPDHKEYEELSVAQRNVVNKLGPLLRLAEALDREHAGKVKRLHVTIGKAKVKLRLAGRGGLLLEKWAVARNSAWFENVYRRKLEVN